MKFVCNFCNKKFPCGKSLGGHIRIHTNESLVDSSSYNGSNLRKNSKQKKNLVDQREFVTLKQQHQRPCCREFGKGFVSLKALCAHTCNSHGEKMVMDNESDTETSSAPTRKRSKRVLKQSNSESFSNESSSYASEIDQEHKDGAFSLMMMSLDSNFKKGHNLVVNSLAESWDNNSVILETKSSSREKLKILNVKNQVAVNDNGVSLCDTDSRSRMVDKESSAKKKSKGHKCPFCFKVFKSGQALGGHKRSHSIGNHLEHRMERQTFEMRNQMVQIDLNLPVSDIDE